MSDKPTVTACQADPSKESPHAFMAIGIGYETPVKIGKAEGKVIGFKGEYTAIVQFGISIMEVEMEAFL